MAKLKFDKINEKFKGGGKGRPNGLSGPIPGAGRPKGAPNKATLGAREAIKNLLDGCAPRLQQWLEEVYQKDGPNEALKRVGDMLEFAVPKLARTEHTGADGGAMELNVTRTDAEIIERMRARLLEDNSSD